MLAVGHLKLPQDIHQRKIYFCIYIHLNQQVSLVIGKRVNVHLSNQVTGYLRYKYYLQVIFLQ